MAIELVAPTKGTSNASVASSIKIQTVLLNSSLIATGLGAGETISIVFSVDDGATWHDMYLNGTQATLDSTNNVVGLNSCVMVSVNKPATANPVGVYLSTMNNV